MPGKILQVDLINLVLCYEATLSAFFLGAFLTQITAQVTVTGIVLDENTQQPLSGIMVRTALPDETATDEAGRFTLQHAPGEFITLVFELNGKTEEYGNIDLSGFTGHVRVGFKYVGSGPDALTTSFRIDNVKVEKL